MHIDCIYAGYKYALTFELDVAIATAFRDITFTHQENTPIFNPLQHIFGLYIRHEFHLSGADSLRCTAITKTLLAIF